MADCLAAVDKEGGDAQCPLAAGKRKTGRPQKDGVAGATDLRTRLRYAAAEEGAGMVRAAPRAEVAAMAMRAVSRLRLARLQLGLTNPKELGVVMNLVMKIVRMMIQIASPRIPPKIRPALVEFASVVILSNLLHRRLFESCFYAPSCSVKLAFLKKMKCFGHTVLWMQD